jgi:hypothetical protein
MASNYMGCWGKNTGAAALVGGTGRYTLGSAAAKAWPDHNLDGNSNRLLQGPLSKTLPAFLDSAKEGRKGAANWGWVAKRTSHCGSPRFLYVAAPTCISSAGGFRRAGLSRGSR